MCIVLAMATADGHERSYPIMKSRTIIGASSRCDLRVPIPALAEKHCEIVASKGRLIVRDLGTQLGTFINGKRIGESSLHRFDHLQLGPITFVLRNDRATTSHRSATTTD